MNDLIIKICGITTYEDAEFLIQNNISIMGLIFYPKSKRYISLEKAKKLIKNLGSDRKKIKIAGVFVNEDINNLLKIADSLSLDYIQLHGAETLDYINKLKNYKIIKAFRISDDFKRTEIELYNSNNIEYFLLDTFQKDKIGGTGKTFNWDKHKYLSKINNIFISGGLNENNILNAIKFFNPSGIDLNSGVEISPGKKDKDKIKKVINIINLEDF